MKVIENLNIYGLEESVKAAKYSYSTDITKLKSDVTPGIDKLGMTKAGSGHCNFLVGIIVQFDLTLSIKCWTEAERYHFLDIVSSQSTIHKIASMNIAESCIEYVSPEIREVVERLVYKYNQTKSTDDYLRLLYNIPTGIKLTARMTTNYLQLKTIYKQRKNHILPEWKEFCKTLEKLPMSHWITDDNVCSTCINGHCAYANSDFHSECMLHDKFKNK